MKSLTIGEVSGALEGELVQGDPSIKVDSVSTDTRSLCSGELFLALRGENHDAHDYLECAVDSGARALIVEEYPKKLRIPTIKVSNTLKALQDLANYNREQFEIPIIGITGSSGKTTTKDMVASVLSQKYKVLKTEGNYNNEVGLPKTLLQLDENHDVVVLEMAMRARGEIDLLSRISLPTAGVITNIGEAHLEKLGSVKKIAQSKAELLDFIPSDGFAVLNGETPYLTGEAYRCKGKVIYYGSSQDNDFYIENAYRNRDGYSFTVVESGKKYEMHSPLSGLHNVYNALAAVAVGLQLGLSCDEISRGLLDVTFSGMRSEVIKTGNYTIINDTYNANPDSMRAALQGLQECSDSSRTVAVLGDMFELGHKSLEGHDRVGETACHCGVKKLITVGELAENIAQGAEKAGMSPYNIRCCLDNTEAIDVLTKILEPGDVILVKGSRGMRMEEIVNSVIKIVT